MKTMVTVSYPTLVRPPRDETLLGFISTRCNGEPTGTPDSVQDGSDGGHATEAHVFRDPDAIGEFIQRSIAVITSRSGDNSITTRFKFSIEQVA